MDLNTKYRPKSFNEVLGHSAVVKALQNVLQDKTLLPHAFLFAGPPGVGKTSLARILASELGCKSYNVVEQDSTMHTSVESMRELITTMRYPAMGGSQYRAVILDEVQDLNKQVWETISKDIEEPPAHLFWILCTTEYNKLPSRLSSRLHPYFLKPIKLEIIRRRLVEIKVAENLSISDDVLEAIAVKSQGILRTALSLLSAFRSGEGTEEIEAMSEYTISEEMMKWCKEIVDLREIPDLKEFIKLNGEELRKALIWYSANRLLNVDTFHNWQAIMSCLNTPLQNGSHELLFRLTDRTGGYIKVD